MVVLCAANSFDAVKMQDQHIAERLSTIAPVLYVDPPMSRLTVRNRPELSGVLDEPRLRMLTPSLARLTPVVLPFPERAGMAAVTERLVGMAVRRAVRTLGGKVHAVIASRPLVPTLGVCEAEVKVFWAQDDLVGGADLLGASEQRMRRGEQRLAHEAGMIIAGTPHVAEIWEDRGFRPVLIPYGCDAEGFAGSALAPDPADVTLPGPIAGFVGHLADRIDISLLEAIAERGHSLLLVGPRHPKFSIGRLDGLLARPNVQWVGAKSFKELPSYLKSIDVGLVPYSDSAFNRGSFPLKTLEYLAAGLPCVATDLPATRWLATDLIDIVGDPAGYADRVGAWLDAPKDPLRSAERMDFALQHSWGSRAVAMADAMGLTADAVT